MQVYVIDFIFIRHSCVVFVSDVQEVSACQTFGLKYFLSVSGLWMAVG